MKFKLDKGLFIIVLMLLIAGVMLVMSSSTYYSFIESGNSYKFVYKDIIFVMMGIVAFLLLSNIDYRRFDNGFLIILANITSITLLVLTLLIGTEVNGSKRWLDLGFTRFMPVDVSKVIIVFTLAYMLKRLDKIGMNGRIAVPIGLLLVGQAALINMQPDMSSMAVFLLIGVSIIGVFFFSMKQLLLSITVAIGGGYFVGKMLILSESYRLDRFMEWWQSLSNIDMANDQIKYSILAISSGGLFGVGPGKSIFNKLYIPEPHNDMILSTLGEEYGLIGMLVVFLLYVLLLYRMGRLSAKATDPFAKVIVFGIMIMITAQIMINYMTSLGMIPPTGIPLPFISYGGTNLLILMASMGILSNISSEVQREN